MVVLEGGGMLTSGSNQYLQPDYLSPLPTTLDAKKSPLALLAQTCSQIGADSPNSKPLIAPLEKPKKPTAVSAASEGSAAASPPGPKPDKQQTLVRASSAEPVRGGLAFKPYEANVFCKKTSEENRPPSKTGSIDADDKRSGSGSRAPSRKSATPEAAGKTSAPPPAMPSSGAGERGKSVSPANEGASPIIRSGLEILHGHPKDLPLGTYKAALPSGIGALGGALGSLCSGCPPGLEPTNPAFRPPFAGGPYSHHHAAMLAAAGYQSGAPYVHYARVKTASGGEALVPVCKDPYCTGCQYSAAHQQLLLASTACPSGCTQCDHQKFNLAALSAGLLPPGPAPPLTYRPYVCNWIAGDAYCGKRFGTSDELLQHLRTHTSLATAAEGAANPMALLGHHSFLHRYPNPPLSPLSAARYHPYSKPGALPGALSASPFSAFNPTALGPYYSPYSIYGQRIGAAAVHP